MASRNRNTALVLIAAGMYLFLGRFMGFPTVSALVIIWLGLHRLRTSGGRTSFIPIGIGVLILLGNHMSIMLALGFIFFGLYFMRSKRMRGEEDHSRRQRLIESINWDREAWTLRSMSMWFGISEIRMDFSLAFPEEKETTILLQGIIGDIDLIVNEDIGVEVVSSVMFGQTDIGGRKESGIMNKLVWKSPGYETSPYRVKLMLSYVMADIDIKVLG